MLYYLYFIPPPPHTHQNWHLQNQMLASQLHSFHAQSLPENSESESFSGFILYVGYPLNPFSYNLTNWESPDFAQEMLKASELAETVVNDDHSGLKYP